MMSVEEDFDPLDLDEFPLKAALYEFLRHGDQWTVPPDEYGFESGRSLNMELGKEEHEYLADVISAWFLRLMDSLDEVRAEEEKVVV